MTVRYDPHLDWAREDRERAAEAARPALETLVAITCWEPGHAHASVIERDHCQLATLADALRGEYVALAHRR